MTLQEQIAVMQAYADGKPVEWKLKDSRIDWEPHDLPSWNWSTYDYRIAVTKPSIDWSHVADEFRWMCTGGGGTTHLFKDKPKINLQFRMWNCVSEALFADAFASFRPGTCDWRDSLVERPK